ncbi:bacteriohemerythrin [candidate division KSB1 bacterium]
MNEKKQKILEWDDSLIIGITWIDNQHKKIIEKINTMFQAIMRGVDRKDIEEMLTFLENYSNVHFNSEEKYMKEYNFDGLEHQKKQHSNFIKKIREYRKNLHAYQPPSKLAITIEKDLLSWFKAHIQTLDCEFGDHLRDKYEFK